MRRMRKLRLREANAQNRFFRFSSHGLLFARQLSKAVTRSQQNWSRAPKTKLIICLPQPLMRTFGPGSLSTTPLVCMPLPSIMKTVWPQLRRQIICKKKRNMKLY